MGRVLGGLKIRMMRVNVGDDLVKCDAIVQMVKLMRQLAKTAAVFWGCGPFQQHTTRSDSSVVNTSYLSNHTSYVLHQTFEFCKVALKLSS